MRYSFCPVCGNAIGERRRDLLVCGTCRYNFYLNTKPCVGAIILQGTEGAESILLTRRGIEPHKGKWDLPGGFLGNGEHPEEALKRELQEELGVIVSNPRFLTFKTDEYPRDDIAEEARFVISLFYLCEIPHGARLIPADDVSEVGWFPFAVLPFELAFKANQSALQEARAFLGRRP
jgi:ADP-ribose pyrophosphatase YjhB (NUDIX family)